MGECPFCEYSGAERSVEAHISGKSDEAHQGRVGRDWRATIRRPLDASFVEPEEAEASGEPDGEPEKVPEADDEEIATYPRGDVSSSSSAAWTVVGSTLLFAVVVLAMSAEGGA